MQYTVGVSAKRSIKRPNPHSGVCSMQYVLVQKGQLKGQAYTVRYAVGMQYAVCVNAKRSSGTVNVTNMGGGDP